MNDNERIEELEPTEETQFPEENIEPIDDEMTDDDNYYTKMDEDIMKLNFLYQIKTILKNKITDTTNKETAIATNNINTTTVSIKSFNTFFIITLYLVLSLTFLYYSIMLNVCQYFFEISYFFLQSQEITI